MDAVSQYPPFDLTKFLPYRLSIAAERVSRGLAARYRSEFGISVAEWRVLVHLLHEGQVSVRDIEERVHLEKSKVSRAASRLVAAGHVDKRTDPGDRRLVALSLTEQGRTLMARLVPLALDFQREIEQLLGPDLRGLERGLDRLSETVPGND